MLDIGDVYSRGLEVRDEAGTLTTPATRPCTITLPDGTTTTPTLTVEDVGVLRLDYLTTQAGRHTVEVVTTDPDSAHTLTFDVDDGTTAIVSLADAKSHLNIRATDYSNDEEVRLWLQVASEWVEERVGYVARRTVVETVHPSSDGSLWLSHPVIELTTGDPALGYSGSYDVADWYVEDNGRVSYGYSGSRFLYPVVVTYVAGLAVVPAKIRAATLLMLKALWETQRGAAALTIQGGVDEVSELPGMGLAVWRAEKLLEGEQRVVLA